MGGLKPSFFGPRLRSTQLLIPPVEKTCSNLTFAYFSNGCGRNHQLASSLLCWTERRFFDLRLVGSLFVPYLGSQMLENIKIGKLWNWRIERGKLAHTNPGYLEGFGVRQAQKSEVGDVVFGFVFCSFFCVHFFFGTTKTMSKISGQLLDCCRGLCLGNYRIWNIGDTSLDQTHRDSASKGKNTKAGFNIYTPWNSPFFFLPPENRGPFVPPKKERDTSFLKHQFSGGNDAARRSQGIHDLLPHGSLFGAAPFETPEKMGLIKALGVVKGKMWRNSKTNLVVKPDLTRFPLLRGSLNC